jgi:hypothetical protein
MSGKTYNTELVRIMTGLKFDAGSSSGDTVPSQVHTRQMFKDNRFLIALSPLERVILMHCNVDVLSQIKKQQCARESELLQTSKPDISEEIDVLSLVKCS